MRKYVLVALVALMSTSVMAGKKECNKYWNPKIKEVNETIQHLDELWVSMPQMRDAELLSKIRHFQYQALCMERARDICFETGLQESKDAFDKGL